ncbi:MAG: efflux transporter outer membrane subunit [Proteobacteria bacterium]|nr:efflux transporter outer membrane subunit [Pseudomonadota bacterium]
MKGLRTTAPLLLAALLVPACSGLAPSYQRPPAPVAAQFPQAPQAPAGAAVAAADLAWADFFANDARLRRLIEAALQNNRDLRVALLNVEQAREQLRVRQADLWPTVGAGLSATRTATPGGNSTRVYSAGLQVSAYELDLFGRLRSLDDAAAAQVLASDEARKAAQISLVATLANAWLALLADDAALQVTRQTLATREDTRRLTELRLQYGAVSRLDLRQVDSLLEAARVALAQQQRQRALDRNVLELLLGQPLPADWLPEEGSVSALPELPDVPVGLPSEVLTRRPDVRQAEALLVAANANIGAARAALFPRITLTASAGSVSSELSGLFAAGSWGFGLAPALLQTIFDAGRNQANVRSAERAREIAVAQYERALQSAFREVADALAGRSTLDDQRRAQAAQVDAERERLSLVELRQRSGAASTLELLDAQRSLFAARLALVQVQAAQAQNGVALYRALGGGWSEAAAGR